MSNQKHYKKVMKQIDRCFANEDIDGMIKLMAKDVVWEIPGPVNVPYTGRFVGRDGFRSFMQVLGETVELKSGGIFLTAFTGNTVLGNGQEAGIVKSTGKSYHYGFVQRYDFNEDGLISSMYQYFDPEMVSKAFIADAPTGGS